MEYEPILDIKENHLIPLLSDYGFKVSFATDSEFSRKAIELLAHLEVPIDTLEYLRNEIEAMTIEARSGIYDVVCKDGLKRIFIIEMQTGNYTYFKERIMFYLFQMYCALVKKGDTAFKDLQTTYCICIVKDKITAGEDYYQKFMIRNERGENFSGLVEIHLVELGKFPYLREEHTKIESEFDQLLYTMKFAHTYDTRYTADFPKFWGYNWLNPTLARLDQNKMSPEDKALLEMSLITLRMLAEEYKKEVEVVRKATTESVNLIRMKKAILNGKLDLEDIADMFDVSVEYVLQVTKSMGIQDDK